MRYLIVSVCVMVLLVGLLPTVGATPPAGPVTIVTAISFAAFPFSGTFTVAPGSALLGCSSGTFVDFPFAPAPSAIRKVFNCETGGVGTFTFLFRPSPAPGPGDANGHWEVLTGTGDFVSLRGEGDFSVVFTSATTGVETLTGKVHVK